MLCIQLLAHANDWAIVRLTDATGIVCSYVGAADWVKHRLFTEQGIDYQF